MNRRTFVHAAAAACPAFMFAPPLAAAAGPAPRASTGFKVATGSDRNEAPLTLFEGDTFQTKVSGRDTAGALYIFESTRIKSGGPAEHVHPDQDEWWYILSGQFVVRIGTTLHELGPGDSVFGPRGVPHVWAKVGDDPGRLIIAFQPAGGMEELFQAIASGRIAALSPDEQDRFRREHGVFRTGPALFHHKQ